MKMAAKRVTFDPDGDLLLRLTYAPEPATSSTPSNLSGGLFGSRPAAGSSTPSNLSGGLFGSRPAAGSSTPSNLGGGIFSSRPAAGPSSASTPGGIFGSRPPVFNTSSNLVTSSNTTPLETSTNISSCASFSFGASTPNGLVESSTPTPESDGQSINEEESEVINEEESEALNEEESEALNEEESEVINEVEMLVSAKHLMLASPVFKAMFKHNFVEGETLRSTGKVEVALPDDDTTAMEIILNIIHGRVRQVPKEVSLDIATALSILVDKYQMQEVVELYVELWMARLKPSMPKSYSADLYKWMSVAWVFKIPDVFKNMSWIAARETYPAGFFTPPPDPSLPIPELVLAEIGEQRRKAISDALAVIARLKDKLMSPGPTFAFGSSRSNSTIRVCTSNSSSNIDIGVRRYSCEGMILGTLLKGLSDKGLWPLPAHPYTSYSFKIVAMLIRGIKITSLCDTLQETANYRSPAGFTSAPSVSNMHSQAHGEMKSLHDQVDQIESRITGLTLEMFERKRVPSTTTTAPKP